MVGLLFPPRERGRRESLPVQEEEEGRGRALRQEIQGNFLLERRGPWGQKQGTKGPRGGGGGKRVKRCPTNNQRKIPIAFSNRMLHASTPGVSEKWGRVGGGGIERRMLGVGKSKNRERSKGGWGINVRDGTVRGTSCVSRKRENENIQGK